MYWANSIGLPVQINTTISRRNIAELENVLSVIRAAAEQKLPHVYLGFFVEGCGSLAYKARFRPNQVLHPDGTWRPFVE